MSQLAQPGADAEHAADLRPALTLLTGFDPRATLGAADMLTQADPGLLVVTHDLTELVASGRIHRVVRDGTGVVEDEYVTLDHGCVSCTIREDVLPALVRLARTKPGRDLVLVLPPAVEPESVASVCSWCHVDGRPVSEAVRLDSVVAVCDPGTLLATLDSDQDLADRDMQLADDDARGVADVAARQIESADTVVMWAPDSDPDFEHARLSVLLHRLNPWARHVVLDIAEPTWLSAKIRRTGRFDPDAPELYGRGLEGYSVGCHEPEPDCGVVAAVYRARRPFHPERFHAALPTLASRTIRGRGHLWLAAQPDQAVAWESGGGGVSMGVLGPWLAAVPDEEWDEASPERRVNADLNWDPEFGDRDVHLAFVGLHFDPAEITDLLDSCLLTDAELESGREAWREFPDPFAGCFDSTSERNQE